MSDTELLPVQEQSPAPTSTLSIASLMLGILGWILIPIVRRIIAIATGHMARRENRQAQACGRNDPCTPAPQWKTPARELPDIITAKQQVILS